MYIARKQEWFNQLPKETFRPHIIEEEERFKKKNKTQV